MPKYPRHLVVPIALLAVAATGLAGTAGAVESTSTSTTTSSGSSSAATGTTDDDGDDRTWSRVTDATDSRNTDEVGLARTADGVLHAFWRARLGPSQEVVRHTPISSSGAVGTSVTAGGPVASAGNPVAIVTGDGGLRVFFAGLTGSESSLDGVLSASSDVKATTWSPTAKVSSTSSAIPEGVGAGLAPDGTPAFAYAYSFVLGYHLGLDPATPDVDLVPGTDCCAYGPSVAFTDTQGVVGWYSNVVGAEGWRAQTVYPQAGTAVSAPDPSAVGKWLAPSQRTPLVARTGTDEVYLAYCSGYPTCDSILLWEVGAPTAEVVAEGDDIEKVNVASDDDGRLWIVWQDRSTGALKAMRSDDDVTAFVGVAEFDPPEGTDTVWHLAGSATDDQIDVVGSFTTDAGINAWHTVVLPGLHADVEASKRSTTFAVTDSDWPVKGATVTLGKQRAPTNGKGLAVVKQGSGRATSTGDPVATVTKAGYTTATVPLE